MLVKNLICILLVFVFHGVVAEEKETTAAGQCVGSSELEGLRYHLYSELTDSRKEIDSLKTDLQYWQNATLSILKKHLLDKPDEDSSSSLDTLDTIREKLAMLVQSQNIQTDNCNITEDMQVIESYQRAQFQELQEMISELSQNITKDIPVTVREIMESYQRAQSQELREIISELSSGRLPLGTFLNPAPSCKHVPEGSSSGNYWIQNAGTGYASLEYCDMTRRCCNSTGGWMRVAHLDMTNPSHHCPSGFRKINSPKRTCGRPGSGCYSTIYPVWGVSHSHVCGRVKAYQYYSPDALVAYHANRAVTIDGVYVDGVSLTHGQNPRKHIWTFANALDEVHSNYLVCPCTKTDTLFTGAVPPFIENDYFCDTGSRYHYASQFYSADPLWDGEGCGGSSTCCQFNNPPWFCKRLAQPTNDDIELRLCADQGISDEDTAIEQVEIFVQ